MFVNQRAWGIVGKVGGSIINKWITYVSRQSSSTHAVPSTEEHRTVRDSRKFLIAFNEIISLREQSVNKKKEKGGNEKCMRDAKDQSTASTAACVDSLEKGKKKKQRYYWWMIMSSEIKANRCLYTAVRWSQEGDNKTHSIDCKLYWGALGNFIPTTTLK